MAPIKLVAVLSAALWHGTDGMRTARRKVSSVGGVPVYGGDIATSSHTDLIVAFKPDVTDSVIDRFCAKQLCLGRGHPDRGGVAYAGVKMGDTLEKSVFDHADQMLYLRFDGELFDDEILEENRASASQEESPWGLERIGVHRSRFKGEGTNIYVLDAGIRSTHVDFGGRAIPTLQATEQPPLVCDPSDLTCALDNRGHGTHCAGTAGGTNYGVAPKALLYALNRGGSWLDAFNSIDWVTLNHKKPAVLTMSFGAYEVNEIGRAVVDAVVAAGVIVTTSAGNNGLLACGHTFAHVPSAITVGCTDEDDARSYFSNWGSCVDIFAPGRRTISAIHTNDIGTKIMSGTSMANPHVAGAAALILEENPSFTPPDVKKALLANAEKNVITDEEKGSPNLLLKVA